MDFKMPVMDGCEASMKIKEYLLAVAPFKKQPIIVCTTSYSGDVFKKKAQEAGMDLFLNKPLFKSTLLRLLGKLELTPH